MKFRDSNKTTLKETGPRDRWLLPYADLVTILLALFVVLYAAADHERAEAVASTLKGVPNGGSSVLPFEEKKKSHQISKDILSDPVLSKHAIVKETSSGVTVSLEESALFAAGDSALSFNARETLRVLAGKLADSKGSIRVEGHTDSIPISNQRFRSNWELSTGRAASVLLHLTNNGVEPSRLSASGYGGFRPVADNATAEGRRKNRRVDIVIVLERTKDRDENTHVIF